MISFEAFVNCPSLYINKDTLTFWNRMKIKKELNKLTDNQQDKLVDMVSQYCGYNNVFTKMNANDINVIIDDIKRTY